MMSRSWQSDNCTEYGLGLAINLALKTTALKMATSLDI